MSLTSADTAIKEIFTKLDQRFDQLEQRLERMEENLNELKISQAEIPGDIKALDEKVTGLGKRIENQEFTNRGILVAVIIALIGGAAKFFGIFPNP